jgi:epoxyqueuosine reductase
MGDVPTVEALREVGLQAGLDAVGVARAEPFLGTRAALHSRRAQGLHGGMAFTYRNPDRSTDPQRLLRDARSLVVGARGYLRADEPHLGSGDGRVARYAWEDHYGLLKEGLQAIGAVLRSAGYRSAASVDQNALVDREAAHRAGLGWYGKNTNLLLPGKGSWFVLGSLVTDAPLEPAAAPVPDGCGSCHRCLDLCPTGAFVEPGVLDANRCLAWLLQAPGVFPREHRVALGDRIYGCDTCQEVCPPNRRTANHRPAAGEREEDEFTGTAPVAVHIGRRPEPWVDLLEVLEADDEEVLRRWGRWYLADRQPRYLRRNALVALGNVGAPGHPAVRRAVGAALAADDPLLRAHAAWAACRLGYHDLLGPLADDPDPLVREELAAASTVVAR